MNLNDILELEDNKIVFESLCENKNVVPFIGAGLSVLDVGKNGKTYPLWKEFLESFRLTDEEKLQIHELLEQELYEEAASYIVETSDMGSFRDRVKYVFSENRMLKFPLTNTLNLIPNMFNGAVLTTNLDKVLENAWAKAGFDFKAVITPDSRDQLNRSLRQGDRNLIKLHGSVEEDTWYVITKEQYDHRYGQDSGAKNLGNDFIKDLSKYFVSRSFLFLGSSLKGDRFLKVFSRIKSKDDHIEHFAILPLEHRGNDQIKRIRKLREDYGIRVIWYEDGKYESIYHILRAVYERWVDKGFVTRKKKHDDLKQIKNYISAFSVDDENIDESLSLLLGYVDREIQPRTLVERFLSPGAYINRGDKFRILFKNKIDDVKLLSVTSNLGRDELEDEVSYKELVDGISSKTSKGRYLIVGEAGSGKTALTHFMVDRFLKNLNLGDGTEPTDGMMAIRIPCFLFKTLDEIVDPGFFSKIYQGLDTAKPLVLEWMKMGKVCVIFDGLDELYLNPEKPDKIDLEGANINRRLLGLNEYHPEDADKLLNQEANYIYQVVGQLMNTYSKCPIIFTSRIHFYDNHLLYRVSSGKDLGIRLFQIKPLTRCQQNKYIRSRVGNDDELAEAIIHKIHNTANLYDLAPVPVLLEMIVYILMLERDKKILNDSNKTQEIKGRFFIYNQIVDTWCKFNSEKIKQGFRKVRGKLSHSFLQELSDADDDDLKEKHPANDIHTRLLSELLMIVALAMFKNENESHGGLLIKEGAVKNYLTEVASLNETDAGYLISIMNSIYSESENVEKKHKAKSEMYAFSHKTILEFLVAKAIYLKLMPNNANRVDLSKGQILLNGIGLQDLLGVPIDFQDDDEVLRFVGEFAQSKDERRTATQTLLKLLESRKDEKGKEQPSVININIVKILAHINYKDLSIDGAVRQLKLGVEHQKRFKTLFRNRNLKGIRLIDTNFSGQDFSRANLSEGILRGAGLAKCDFSRANFTEANLRAAYLGESASIWSMTITGDQIITDDGGGDLEVRELTKGVRRFKDSYKDNIIWDIHGDTISGEQIAVSAQQGNTLSFLNINSGKRLRFMRKHNETLFACCISESSKVFFAGLRGNVYVINNLSPLWEESDFNVFETNGQNRMDYPESFRHKHHRDTIFGLALSTDQNHLHSCGADGVIHCWNVEAFESKPSLSSGIPQSLDFYSVLDGETDEGNALRKLRVVEFRGHDYVIAGSQLGTLLILKVVYNHGKVKYREVLKWKNLHDDWILDVHCCPYNDDILVFTASGDQYAKALLMSKILNDEDDDIHTCWERFFTSALLSIYSFEDHVYFGSYDGSVLREEVSYVVKAASSNVKQGMLVSDHVFQSVNRQPSSLVKNAKNANFNGVKGLNKGRILLLSRKGANVSIENSISQYKIDFCSAQHKFIESFVDELTAYDAESFENCLDSFLAEFNEEKPVLRHILADLNGFVQVQSQSEGREDLSEGNDSQNDGTINSRLGHEVIGVFESFLSLKTILATIGMVYYWLKRDYSKPDSNGKLFRDFLMKKLKSGPWTKEHSRLRYQEVFMDVQRISRTYLESHYGEGSCHNEIFEICHESYVTQSNLRDFCDFIAGKEVNSQIPSSLNWSNFKLANIWTVISNSFWTGSSNIAETYFEDFAAKIYKCCAEMQQFLIESITHEIRKKLSQKGPGSSLHYHDFATGKKGTIAVGVYNNLSEHERSRVTITASDSSDDIVDMLSGYLVSHGIRIYTEVQNMACIEVSGELDIITQSLGGHHLPKDEISSMYTSFLNKLSDGGIIGVSDVMLQPIKILAGLPDDVGAPEYPYDVRNLEEFLSQNQLKSLVHLQSDCFPKLGENDGFYTAQVYKKMSHERD